MHPEPPLAPLDEDELPDEYIKRAIECLDDVIVDKAWQLYEADKQQANRDGAEKRAMDREDRDA